MSAATLLAYSWLFPIATLLLSAAGLPKRAGALSWLSPFAVFVVAIVWLAQGHPTEKLVVDGWIPFLPDAAARFTVDGLSGTMLLVVGGVATCIFIYAIGYMRDDERAHRFFAFLDFFVACMVLLVVAGNLGVLLIGWTGVGIASFLLISFWWKKGYPLQAGFMALGANAIGDAALLVAVVLVPKGAGELTGLIDVADKVPGGAATIAWCLVIAACAKSAQGPLWWWLPAAMAGPTPVSALIHAATMVAAGVYLLVRTEAVLELAPTVAYTTAWIGLLTAIGGGLASLWQPNFKRGLAYSTVSQLGWMFTAVAVGAPFAALFHLVTHAAFKAMLFLSAGTVIAACHHEEDITKVGGLAKKLPGAFAYFVIGTLALIGTPVITAGSFSKDAILEGALHSEWPWFGYALLASTLLTGAYAGRLLFGVFLGREGEASAHAHAPGKLFDLPLVPLALGAIGLGYVEAQTHLLSSLLGTAVKASSEPVHLVSGLGFGAFGVGVVGVAIGAVIARTKSKALPAPPDALMSALVGEAKALPEGVAALHSGAVGRYALLALIGTAIAVAVSLAPVSEERAKVRPSDRKAPSGAPQRDKADRSKRPTKGNATPGAIGPGATGPVAPGTPSVGKRDPRLDQVEALRKRFGVPPEGGATPEARQQLKERAQKAAQERRLREQKQDAAGATK